MPGVTTYLNEDLLVIIDTVTLEKLSLQFVPSELRYNPESNFIAIASMGRNNPLYHYTGSEDILELDLKWISAEVNREDVLLKCRFLEALSKNNAFKEPPHPIKLFWGGKLFNDAQWLVSAAPYEVTLFHKVQNMLPQIATQHLRLIRITPDNLTSLQIRSLNN